MNNFSLSVDLRDDKQFFSDHPGAVPITTAQVYFTALFTRIPSYIYIFV